MKRALILAIALVTSLASFGQILEPVTWSFSSNKVSETEYDLIFKADIDLEWAVYSQFIGDEGPIPTSFTFEENEAYERIGSVSESDDNKVTKYDAVFDMELSKFYNQAVFTQRVKLSSETAVIKGFLSYMTCDDRQCLPPTDEPFEFSISSSGVSASQGDLGEDIAVDEEATNALLYGLSPSELKRTEVKCTDEAQSTVSQAQESGKSLLSIFGLGMLTIAITGMFIAKGSESFRKRGWKLALVGIVFPLIFLFLLA